MEMVAVHPEPLIDCAFHGIGLKAVFRVTKGTEAPVSADGWICAHDGKFLGNACAKPQERTDKYPLSAREWNQPDQGQLEYVTHIVIPLSREAIDHVERERERDKKKDVRVKAIIQLAVQLSKAVLAHVVTDNKFTPQNIGQSTKVSQNLSDASIVLYKWDRDARPSLTDLFLVSGDGGRDFLEVTTMKFERDLIIAASDWVQDYVPALGIGRSLNMELPMPEELDLPDLLKKRFKVVIDDLQKMLDDYKHGEWTDLIEDSRGVYELLKDETLVRNLLTSDGYPSEAIDDICKCLKALWDFTSKFHHHLDKSKEKLMPELKSSKEEAELIYALSLTLVNLLARKAMRQS